MTVYCRLCGLVMTNGFCLHGSADETIMAEKERVSTPDGRIVSVPTKYLPPRPR